MTASTAVAAMEAYKAMAGIPIVGPALGAIAAAAAIASGAAQIAVAKQQRDEAKGLKSGGYVDEYVEGYTKNGNPDDVAGVIPVHKNEFVANHEGVANPHVRQFWMCLTLHRKTGQSVCSTRRRYWSKFAHVAASIAVVTLIRVITLWHCHLTRVTSCLT